MLHRVVAAAVRVYTDRHPTPDFVIRKEPDGSKGGQGEPYMLRWNVLKVSVFGKELGGLKIHRFLMPDQDRDPHDHPWPWFSYVVEGHYYEERYEVNPKGRRREFLGVWHVGDGARRRWNAHRSTDLHRVRLPVTGRRRQVVPGVFRPPAVETHRPATSLFVHGPRIRVWGYRTGTGAWVRWDHYLGLDVTDASRAVEDTEAAKDPEYGTPWCRDRDCPIQAPHRQHPVVDRPRVLP